MKSIVFFRTGLDCENVKVMPLNWSSQWPARFAMESEIFSCSPRIWNAYSDSVKNSTDCNSVRLRLKAHLCPLLSPVISNLINY